MIAHSYVPMFDDSYYRLFSILESSDLSSFNPRVSENPIGMRVTSGVVSLDKDSNNLFGISISGGAPHCPCLYIVQVFDNTPAAKFSTLQAGDEITAINGINVKGKTKEEVAKIIQELPKRIIINYNKLHVEDGQGKTLDIYLKKLKHKLVENMSSSTADALGLSRAILYNDNMVRKIQELDRNEKVYRELLDYLKSMLKNFLELGRMFKQFGDLMATMGVKEPQTKVSEAFTQFGEVHRSLERFGRDVGQSSRLVVADLRTFVAKAVSDSRLTIAKYADCKFEYLSYCLKIKEMDDEGHAYVALDEPLHRVLSGNYEYRLVLRRRQEARSRLASLRQDVLTKLSLLEEKRIHDLVVKLQKLAASLALYSQRSADLLACTQVFPVEPIFSPVDHADDLDNSDDDLLTPDDSPFESFEVPTAELISLDT